jgi:hypothetical protein
MPTAIHTPVAIYTIHTPRMTPTPMAIYTIHTPRMTPTPGAIHMIHTPPFRAWRPPIRRFTPTTATPISQLVLLSA